MSIEANKQLVAKLWSCLYEKDFDGVAACIADDGHYEDVPAPDPGARGPENVVKRLRIGLDRDEVTAFLEGDELTADVWRSYGRTIRELNIHSIPLFSFSVPSIGAVGGPFRPPGKAEAYVVRGSMDHNFFLELFEVLLRDVQAGRRIFDQRSQPYRLDEWYAKRMGVEGVNPVVRGGEQTDDEGTCTLASNGGGCDGDNRAWAMCIGATDGDEECATGDEGDAVSVSSGEDDCIYPGWPLGPP